MLPWLLSKRGRLSVTWSRNSDGITGLSDTSDVMAQFMIDGLKMAMSSSYTQYLTAAPARAALSICHCVRIAEPVATRMNFALHPITLVYMG